MTIKQTINHIKNDILNRDYDHETPDVLRSKAFARAIKALLKKMFPDYTIDGGTGYCSPTYVLSDGTHYVYVSISDYRWNICGAAWDEKILYRTMSHPKDWTGGPNRYAYSFEDLQTKVVEMFKYMF